MKYIIFNSNNDEIIKYIGHSLWDYSSTYEYKYCVEQGLYTAERDSISAAGLGWYQGTISLYAYNILLGNYSKSDGEGTKLDILNCIFYYIY